MLQFVDAKITKDEQNKNDRECKKYQHKGIKLLFIEDIFIIKKSR